MLEKRHEMLESDLSPIGEFLFRGPCDELIQQRGVGSLRMLRLPAFVTQVLEKIFNERLHRSRRWMAT